MPNVPAFFLKILFGELANAILEGSRASSQNFRMQAFSLSFLICMKH
jgi:NAD dependent epimerase/dehydratase family enzyme